MHSMFFFDKCRVKIQLLTKALLKTRSLKKQTVDKLLM